MIDTHAHLNTPLFSQHIDEIVEQSKLAGVKGVIMASSNLEEIRIGLDLAKKYPDFLYPTAGIHPQKTDPDNQMFFKQQLAEMEKLIKNNSQIIAVGECGLDDSEPPPGEQRRSMGVQRDLFIGQLELAQDNDLPVIIHARGVKDKVIDLVEEHASGGMSLNGVFHCYTGGKSRINRILDLPGQWYFGIDGNVTYDQGLQNVVSQIPKDKLLLETDTPFLAPEPHRGETNTPAYLPLIAKQIAEIWETDIEQVEKITTNNAQELFRI
jgi:TatD DNase family protein